MTENGTKEKRKVDRTGPLEPEIALVKIAKLRANAHDVAMRRARAAYDAYLGSLPEREEKVLSRVPNERREYALGLKDLLLKNSPVPIVPPKDAAPASDTKELPDWLNDQPPPAPAAVVIDREEGKGRRVGADRR